MSDTMQSLDQLSQLKPATPEAPKYVKKVDKYGRAYATGKRKDAVARVWVKPGSGKMGVNTREVEIYFARPGLRMMIQQPLVAAARAGQYDVVCTVAGGGLSGQGGGPGPRVSPAAARFETARRTERPRPAARSSSPSADASREYRRSKAVAGNGSRFFLGRHCEEHL